jgi:hypothetical protein
MLHEDGDAGYHGQLQHLDLIRTICNGLRLLFADVIYDAIWLMYIHEQKYL